MSAAPNNSARAYSPCKGCGGLTRSAFMEITAGLCRECAITAGTVGEGEPIVEESYIYGEKGITVPGGIPARSGYIRNDALICAHCGHKGGVQTKTEERKEGVSGTKLSAAVLTGGWSVLFSGLSENQRVVACYCEKCGIQSTVR
jgi:hypothetical protein